jgi:hypothetical protein
MIQLSLRADVLPDRLTIRYQVENGTNAPIYLADRARTGDHPSSFAEHATSASTWLLSSGELLILQGWRLTPLMPPDLAGVLPYSWPQPALTRVAAGGTSLGVIELRSPVAATYGDANKLFDTVLTKRFRFALDVLAPPVSTQAREVDGSDAVDLEWEHDLRLTFSGELPRAVPVQATPAIWNVPDGDRHAEMIEANRPYHVQSTGAHLPIWR